MKKKLYGLYLCVVILPVLADQIVETDVDCIPDFVATCMQDQAPTLDLADNEMREDDQSDVELVFEEDVPSNHDDLVDLLVEDTNESQDSSLLAQDDQEEEYLIDALRAIVMTTEGTELVVQSDLERPSITGQVLTLQDRIDECTFYLDAVKQKAVSTEDQIDRYFSAIQRDNNMTLDDLKRTFEMNGLTYMQAREQLGRMQTVNTILELRVMSNVIVPRVEVLAYYDEHEFLHEAVYYLQRAVVPFADDRENQKEELLRVLESGEENGGIRWSMIFALEASEIAADKLFIQEAPLGKILFAGASQEGFELYRVVDKLAEKAMSIDECYAHIERILKKPLYEKLLAGYKEKLFERTTVIYL